MVVALGDFIWIIVLMSGIEEGADLVSVSAGAGPDAPG